MRSIWCRAGEGTTVDGYETNTSGTGQVDNFLEYSWERQQYEKEKPENKVVYGRSTGLRLRVGHFLGDHSDMSRVRRRAGAAIQVHH